jgi:uncharacterized protein
MKTAITMPTDRIRQFCQHWQVIELSLFGSVLRDDFHADSDIDILVAFAATANWGLLEHAKMQEELEILFNRRVDLIGKKSIERSANWIRRQEILSTAQTIYVQ